MTSFLTWQKYLLVLGIFLWRKESNSYLMVAFYFQPGELDKKYSGLLEKKWTSVIRLQKKVGLRCTSGYHYSSPSTKNPVNHWLNRTSIMRRLVPSLGPRWSLYGGLTVLLYKYLTLPACRHFMGTETKFCCYLYVLTVDQKDLRSRRCAFPHIGLSSSKS